MLGKVVHLASLNGEKIQCSIWDLFACLPVLQHCLREKEGIFCRENPRHFCLLFSVSKRIKLKHIKLLGLHLKS